MLIWAEFIPTVWKHRLIMTVLTNYSIGLEFRNLSRTCNLVWITKNTQHCRQLLNAVQYDRVIIQFKSAFQKYTDNTKVELTACNAIIDYIENHSHTTQKDCRMISLKHCKIA